jgi:hypothetical protein
LFAVAIVHLAGAQARFSGWATLLTSTIVAVLSLLDSAFIIAAVKASPTHPATRRSATTRSSARPTTRSGRMFLLTLPLPLPLGHATRISYPTGP